MLGRSYNLSLAELSIYEVRVITEDTEYLFYLPELSTFCITNSDVCAMSVTVMFWSESVPTNLSAISQSSQPSGLLFQTVHSGHNF